MKIGRIWWKWYNRVRGIRLYGFAVLWDATLKRRWENKRRELSRIRNMGRSEFRLYQNTRWRTKQRLLGKKKYGYCVLCQERKPRAKLTVDHIIAIKDGGTNEKTNLQLICTDCHDTKNRISNANRQPFKNQPFKELLKDFY